MKKNSEVESFVRNAKTWKDEITKLRAVLLTTGLNEEFKWRLPCYSHDEKNIVIIQPFKACLGLMFFKGALLKDAKKVLKLNGPNSQSARRLEFRSVEDVTKLTATVKSYIKEAIKIEDAGLKVAVKKTSTAVPADLKAAFSKKPKLEEAFRALTPGRQRAYILHFASAKQSATRDARIEKCAPRILNGKGLTDR